MPLKVWIRISTSRLKSLTSVNTWVHPRFFVGSVLLIFLAFWFVSFALFVVVLCDSCVPNAASISGLQPARHLKHEEGHNCPLAWWRMWDAQINNLLMVDNGCLERFNDPIPFSRCLQMTGVSLGSYMSTPFSPITTSSHDIVIKMMRETINTKKLTKQVSIIRNVLETFQSLNCLLCSRTGI